MFFFSGVSQCWWQEAQAARDEGDFAGEREKIAEIASYCAYDVKVTKCVHEYALKHGHLKYEDRNQKIVQVDLDWT